MFCRAQIELQFVPFFPPLSSTFPCRIFMFTVLHKSYLYRPQQHWTTNKKKIHLTFQKVRLQPCSNEILTDFRIRNICQLGTVSINQASGLNSLNTMCGTNAFYSEYPHSDKSHPSFIYHLYHFVPGTLSQGEGMENTQDRSSKASDGFINSNSQSMFSN